MKRVRTVFLAAMLAAIVVSAPAQTVAIDAAGPSHPFPHFWEQVFGSGRANLTLRESYRRDLRAMRSATGIQYVRFHAIFHDENGVYDEDAQGRPVYNFSYVDQIYDGLLENGARPFVELSFMPRKLSATPPVLHPFWYKPVSSPPKDYAQWGELIRAFGQHLVDRYGIDEVAQWYFEVWNEPNIDFWAGQPKEPTYYQLYAAAAGALKSVNPRLRVGGPATAQAAWVDRLIAYCASNNVPIDFVSTHVYGNDRSQDVFGTDETISRRDMVARAVRKVFGQVKHSARPDLPIHWTEYNASYMNEPAVTDAPFMGPWLANNIRQCDGMVTTMSYWTFSDVFEEQGVVKTPFYGGFGLFAENGIPKAAFNAFRLLHQLGTARLNVDAESVLATRRADGTLEVAAWNYAAPEEAGSTIEMLLSFKGLSAGQHSAHIARVDAEHGSPLKAWEDMGRPANPSRAQIAALQSAAQPGNPETIDVENDGSLKLHLSAHSLVLVEVPVGSSAPTIPLTPAKPLPGAPGWAPTPDAGEFVEDLEHRSFLFFWERADPQTGEVLDRAKADGSNETRRIASIASTGFGLTALCIGAEHGWITREQAQTRALATLRFLAGKMPREHGWYYHFIDERTGERQWKSELSSIDTALLLAGVLTVREYFGEHSEIGSLAESIYEAVDFPWMRNGDPNFLSMGWTPESGFLRDRWDRYCELMILYLEAIGSPRHAIPADSWYAWRRPHVRYEGYDYISAAPLFTHQYAHAWVDFRERREDRGEHTDWFQNSVIATQAHRAFCINLRPMFPDYGTDAWGITASDSAKGYIAWGGPPMDPAIDGTLVPCGPGGSLMFTPDIALRALRNMRGMLNGRVYTYYGFVDAFNPLTKWIDPDVIGIDVGITLLSAENMRTGNVWSWFMRNGNIRTAMDMAGLREVKQKQQ